MTVKKIHLTSKVYHFSRCGLPTVASANVDSNRLAFDRSTYKTVPFERLCKTCARSARVQKY
jgi:hypothetical protein